MLTVCITALQSGDWQKEIKRHRHRERERDVSTEKLSEVHFMSFRLSSIMLGLL